MVQRLAPVQQGHGEDVRRALAVLLLQQTGADGEDLVVIRGHLGGLPQMAKGSAAVLLAQFLTLLVLFHSLLALRGNPYIPLEATLALVRLRLSTGKIWQSEVSMTRGRHVS